MVYSLKLNKRNSEDYYQDVRKFTNQVVEYADDSVLPIVEEYIKYIAKFNLEDIRKKEEYLLELLSFGILWNNYSQKALSVRYAPFITLSRMSEWRKKHQKVKPLIDFIRGILISLFLIPKTTKRIRLKSDILEQVDHLCKWLEATGEFREQALRFIRWRAGNKMIKKMKKFRF